MVFNVVSLVLSLLVVTSKVSCRQHNRTDLYAISSLASNETTKYFHFEVGYKNVTRLNTTKSLIVVNGKFPGPTVYAHEGDRLIITVSNQIKEDVAIHWHGVRQILSCWSDGTAYITQCPVRPGHSFTHNFTVQGQIGTLLWHAHISWLRATLHGAIVIFPRPDVQYPFDPKPDYAVPIVLGEWWNSNTENVEKVALRTGAAPAVSDAATINSYPGPLYKQSHSSTFLFPYASSISQTDSVTSNFEATTDGDVFTLNVAHGKTYQLNLVNAALEVNYYFSIAHHPLTVVAVDASFVDPFMTDIVYLSPGQTADVLLLTNLTRGSYYMAASVFSIVPEKNLGFPHTTTTAILQYPVSRSSAAPILPDLPAHNNTDTRENFISNIRSTPSVLQDSPVPLSIDRSLQFTVGYALEANSTCPPSTLCQGVNHSRFSAAVNNISFDNPWNTSLLEAFFLNEPIRTRFLGFPSMPLYMYNYTGYVPVNTAPRHSTKVVVLNLSSNVELVLQDTAILQYEFHPFHLHGHNFYIVGQGYGNFDPFRDPFYFNLDNPPQRNTAGVPAGGWIAIRWTANNPGVWLLHCHLEMHLSWGMEMAFVVRNGVGDNETLPSPPPDYPRCVRHNSTPH